MKTSAEVIIEGLCNYLNETTLEMLIYSEEEAFEIAADVRDDISNKIVSVKKTLISKKWTTLTDDEVQLQLEILKDGYIGKWEKEMEVPKERRIINI